LILETLARLAASGFERDLIEGTLHQVEFQGKEIKRDAYPYGIILMGRVFHTWIYDGDPLAGLNFPRLIEILRCKWAENPTLFQDMLKVWFLDNPHRLLSVMEPDSAYNDERDAAFISKWPESRPGCRRKRLSISAMTRNPENVSVRSGSPGGLGNTAQTESPGHPENRETIPLREISSIAFRHDP